MDKTKFTIEISYDLPTLKKCYAKFMGERNWRKVKKGDIATWIEGLVEADIEQDMSIALEQFR
jgi:hypothetical protein